MYILKILNQYRRDFTAIYKCENCGNEVKKSGYDDRNFHDNVVPDMKCDKCKKSSNDLDIKPKFVPTKYQELQNI
ncbi:MAG: hypothetical protein LIR50_07320 [Bacillota bacterium]|nr:hypothetical protein [Bacillota bacterium]